MGSVLLLLSGNMLERPSHRNTWDRFSYFFKVWIWQVDTSKMPKRRAMFLGSLRILALSVRGFEKDHCTLKSSALTFLSALAFVPSMIIMFGISRAFGFDIKEEIYGLLKGQEVVVDQIFEYASGMLSKTRGDIIAGVGLLLLFYTVMRLLHNIETTFNSIWDISKDRSLQRKFADYTTILLVSPLLVFLSSSLNVSLITQIKTLIDQWSVLGGVASFALTILARLLPLTLLWMLLGLLYVIMPNTRVWVRSAIFAAIVAGSALQLTQWMYIKFQVGVSSYNTIYGSLAALPLFLIWMHISWNIALYGAELAYAHQNVKNYTYLYHRSLSFRERKYVSLLIMSCISKEFQLANLNTVSSIAQSTQMPQGIVIQGLKDLHAAHLISQINTDKQDNYYQPALDIYLLTPRLIIDRLETTGFTGLSVNHQTKEGLRFRSLLALQGKNLDTRLIDM